MLLILYLALSLCVLTRCNNEPSDAELEAAFKDIENALHDRTEIKSMIADVKKTLTAEPDYKQSFVNIAQSVVSAVPMLTSDNGYTVAQGALNLAAGIASNIPGGTLFASIATLISSVIGIIDTEKTNKIRDTMIEVLRDSRDKDLEDKVHLFKTYLDTLMETIQKYKVEDVRDNAASDITTKATHASSIGALAILEKRLKEYKISHDPKLAKRAFDFSIMYGQLITLEDLVLTKVVLLLRENYPGSANVHENYKNALIQKSRRDLSFWNNPNVEDAGALVYYYPLGSSKSGKFLRGFLKYLKVPEPEPWNPADYILKSVKWPSYHLYFKLVAEESFTGDLEKFYLTYSKNAPLSRDKLIFQKRSDGYFTLKRRAKANVDEGQYGVYAFSGYTDTPYHVYGEYRDRGKDEYYQFIVISYPGTDIITISCRDWPYKFFSGEANKYSVILRNGNSGSDIQFYTNPCLVNESGRGPHRCPAYTPKKR